MRIPIFRTRSGPACWGACGSRAFTRYAFALFFIVTGAFTRASAQVTDANGQLPEGFHAASLTLGEHGPEYRYALFIPHRYEEEPEGKWPMILFLHGSGECGQDGIRQTTVGMPVHVARRHRTFPFIVLMPQAHDRWFDGADEQAVWKMLAHAMETYRVDPDRIYITGLSMGGFATWDLISKRPDVFAAAVPVCGAGDPRYVVNATKMPIWAFHGAQDAAVPVAGSREAVAALRRAGGEPDYTEYPDGDHFIWDQVYQGRRVYDWMLRHKRPEPPRRIEYRMVQPFARVWWLALQADLSPSEPPAIRAEIGDDGTVTVQTQGIGQWALASAGPPLPPGDEIALHWNGQEVFRGKFPGVLRANVSATTQPAENDGDADGATTRPARD